jgi:arylsulfatase A-like enzyme
MGAVPVEQRGGYEYWLASNVLEMMSEPYGAVLYDNAGQPIRLPGYRVDALTDAAIRYIDDHSRKNAQQPFFLFLSFIEPHHRNRLDDYPAPVGYASRYASRWIPPDLAALGGSSHRDLGGYLGMIRRLDEALGRLRDALRSLDALDNTVILFTSDHGSHFKTRNSEYKRSGHESSIRVPTALSGGCFNGGGRIDPLVSLIDLPPTLLDAAGVPVPPTMQGRSLLPLLRGGSAGANWPNDVFIQISESQVARALRTRRWKYIITAPHKDAWNDCCSDRYVEQALYDLEADPYELENLAGFSSHRALCDRLAQRLVARMRQAGEQPPAIDPAPPCHVEQRQLLPGKYDA